jgi:biopolymer transport protein ExbD
MLFVCVQKIYQYNLPEKKASSFAKRNLPPPKLPRGPRMPGDNAIKFPGIAIIIKNDRTVQINEDPVEWDLLNNILEDIYSIRTDKSIRIIKENKVFQEDVITVMDIVKKLHLEVKEIIILEKGQEAIPERLIVCRF